MSWSKIVLIACLLPLASCGFSPVYETKAPNPLTHAKGVDNISPLQYVRVAHIDNRAGQVLRNTLLQIMPDPLSPARYELRVVLTESIDDFGLRRDTTATFARLTVTAHYYLYDLSAKNDARLALSGFTRAISSYNIVASTFAELSSEEDARTRASQELAEDIKLRLAAYFQAQS